MTTLNNLEKLIQMATIEQMYGMIQKMRDDFSSSSTMNKVCTSDSSCLKECNELNRDYIETCKSLEERVSKLEKINKQLLTLIGTLTTKVNTFESSIHSLVSDSTIQQYEQKPIPKGQQLLTRYFDSPKEEEHIKLKIVEVLEEKTTTNIDVLEIEDQDTNEEEEEVEEEKVEEKVVEEDQDTNEEVEVEEDQDTNEEEEEPQDTNEAAVVGDSDESEADSEEEVRTNEEVDEVPTLDVKEEEEEEEEEVFEIEIDDVTYFATDEENGILYAVTDDGDIGEKVGILKDGEPIFT